MEPPIILCGLGRLGIRILRYLQAANLPVVVIDTRCQPDDERLQGARLVCGDCRQRAVLEEADVAHARGVLILTNDDLVNISSTLMVRAINPSVRVVLRMFNQNLLSRLGSVLHNVHTLSTSMLTAPVLAMTSVAGQGFAAFSIDGKEDSERQVVEIQVGAGSQLLGRTIAEVMAYREAVAFAHVPQHAPERFLLEVDVATRLRAGDDLVLCARPRSLASLESEMDADSPHLLWAGWPRRMARVLRRTLAEVDPAVLICTLVLFGVILGSTLILCLGVEKYKVIDALFRTVSVMATGASMYEERRRLFTRHESVRGRLRIVGAALIAAFTAILTNYLLRARLGGALEVRRIPDSGHIIICGLGAIGFRVVEELLRYGEPVVVIERDAGNRFVRAVRQLGAPVIIGDAGVTRRAPGGPRRLLARRHRRHRRRLDQPRHRPARSGIARQSSHRPALERSRFGANVARGRRHSLCPVGAHAGGSGLPRQPVRRSRPQRFPGSGVDCSPSSICSFSPTIRSSSIPCGRCRWIIACRPWPLLPAQGPPPSPLLAGRLRAGDRLVAIIALTDLEPLLRRQQTSACFGVEIVRVPLPARGWLAGLVRTQRDCTEEEAAHALDHLPFCLAEKLTRGQAEEMLARLLRERIDAKLLSSS